MILAIYKEQYEPERRAWLYWALRTVSPNHLGSRR